MHTGRPWTESERQFIRANHATMSRPDMAVRLNRTLKAVRVQVGKLGLAGTIIPPWTAAQMAQLKTLVAAGATRLQIASEMGVGLSAVNGKMSRLNLRSKLMKDRPKIPRSKTPSRAKALKPQPVVCEPATPRPLASAAMPGGGCQFPLWTGRVPRPPLFCGTAIPWGDSWCAAHRRIVYTPRTEQRGIA